MTKRTGQKCGEIVPDCCTRYCQTERLLLLSGYEHEVLEIRFRPSKNQKNHIKINLLIF
ncbi:hypothetical protein CSB69_2203 [Morganella morganii]|nr:hypothetical protein CSB69_2203 [Morganella morganii]